MIGYIVVGQFGPMAAWEGGQLRYYSRLRGDVDRVTRATVFPDLRSARAAIRATASLMGDEGLYAVPLYGVEK